MQDGPEVTTKRSKLKFSHKRQTKNGYFALFSYLKCAFIIAIWYAVPASFHLFCKTPKSLIFFHPSCIPSCEDWRIQFHPGEDDFMLHWPGTPAFYGRRESHHSVSDEMNHCCTGEYTIESNRPVHLEFADVHSPLNTQAVHLYPCMPSTVSIFIFNAWEICFWW